MKKTYISPKAIQVCVETESIVAMSAGVSGNSYNGDVMTREQNTNSPWDNWNE